MREVRGASASDSLDLRGGCTRHQSKNCQQKLPSAKHALDRRHSIAIDRQARWSCCRGGAEPSIATTAKLFDFLGLPRKSPKSRPSL